MTFDAEVPEPTRPLGPTGRALWVQWFSRVVDPDDELLALCETSDERTILRREVLLGKAAPAERVALRALDLLIAEQTDAVKRSAAWRAYAND